MYTSDRQAALYQQWQDCAGLCWHSAGQHGCRPTQGLDGLHYTTVFAPLMVYVASGAPRTMLVSTSACESVVCKALVESSVAGHLW